MLDALETGRALPKMIFWTHYLKDAVTPEKKPATRLASTRSRQ